jgi:hypothetical protein
VETDLVEIVLPASAEVLGQKWLSECISLSSIPFESGSRLSPIKVQVFSSSTSSMPCLPLYCASACRSNRDKSPHLSDRDCHSFIWSTSRNQMRKKQCQVSSDVRLSHKESENPINPISCKCPTASVSVVKSNREES